MPQKDLQPKQQSKAAVKKKKKDHPLKVYLNMALPFESRSHEPFYLSEIIASDFIHQ